MVFVTMTQCEIPGVMDVATKEERSQDQALGHRNA